jgi:hypothetical protein
MTTLLQTRCGRLLAFPLAALAAACTDTTAPDRVIGGGLLLELVSGHDQTFIKGIEGPLVVRVVNIDGQPQVGVSVEWRVMQGGGGFRVPDQQTPIYLKVMESVTDEDGLATVRLRPLVTWEHTLEVSVGNRHLTIDVVAEPFYWRDVLAIQPTVEVVDDRLRAQVRVVNEWIHTVRAEYSGGCWAHSQIYTIVGEPVEGWVDSGCGSGTYPNWDPGVALTQPISPSIGEWQIATSRLEPGIYAIVIRFTNPLRINGRPADLPDVTVMHVVE